MQKISDEIFVHNLRNQWVNQSWINKHDRLWISVFNQLVAQGLIKKKKTKGEYNYKWIAEMPRLY